MCDEVFFLTSRFQFLIPKGYVYKGKDKRNRLQPLRASPNIGNPPPPACAVRKSRGMGPPYKQETNLGTKEGKRLSATSRPLLRCDEVMLDHVDHKVEPIVQSTELLGP
jgi:hypothetical protein